MALGGSDLDIESLATALWVVIDAALLTFGYHVVAATLTFSLAA